MCLNSISWVQRRKAEAFHLLYTQYVLAEKSVMGIRDSSIAFYYADRANVCLSNKLKARIEKELKYGQKAE